MHGSFLFYARILTMNPVQLCTPTTHPLLTTKKCMQTAATPSPLSPGCNGQAQQCTELAS
jgi:hypothetical protein